MKKIKNESLIFVIVSLIVLSFVLNGLGYGGYRGMMGMMYGVYGGGMMFFGWIYGTLILIALVFLIVWLFQQIQKEVKLKNR
jgi:uncharacterized membrane protein